MIECFYDLSWNITEALVAEGITAEVAHAPAAGPGGIIFDARPAHGQWKTQPNSVIRPDGSRLDSARPACSPCEWRRWWPARPK